MASARVEEEIERDTIEEEALLRQEDENKGDKLGQALWARSKFGLWYAAIGVVKMLHTDNKVNTESL